MPLQQSTSSDRTRIKRGVIGIVCRDLQYLMIERAPGVALPGTWCFPGGHVESGECSRRAIIREMHEELGIDVQPIHRLGSVRGRVDVVLAIWIVKHTNGHIIINENEVADYAWLTSHELRNHPKRLPSNIPVADMLDQWASRQT